MTDPFLYENGASLLAGMPATCNCCDRLIRKGEMTPAQYTAQGGNCPQCWAEIKDENEVRHANQD